jgi:hypothetical protein
MQPSDLDMPPLEDRPSLEARVAKLEARVEVLEAALAELLPGKLSSYVIAETVYPKRYR